MLKKGGDSYIEKISVIGVRFRHGCGGPNEDGNI